jgi:hypothetical protein
VPVVHGITTAHLDVRMRPHANATLYAAASNTLTKAFCEHHVVK